MCRSTDKVSISAKSSGICGAKAIPCLTQCPSIGLGPAIKQTKKIKTKQEYEVFNCSCTPR